MSQPLELLAAQAPAGRLGSAELVAGGLLLLLWSGSAVGAAELAVRRRLPSLGGAPRLLAVGVLAAAGFIAINLIPGALGILGRPAVSVCAVLLLGGALLLPAVPAGEPQLPPEAPRSDTPSRILATIAAVSVTAYVVAHGLGAGAAQPTGSVDMLTFHLPDVARWIQSGSVWHLSEFVPYRSFGTYPNTSDVVLLGAILPFESDFLVRFANYPALALLAVAVYALGREIGAAAAPAILFASGVVAIPAVTLVALEGLADTLMLACFAAGIVFLLRNLRTGHRSDLLLAALALGISFGTKWYAPPSVAFAIAAWALARAAARDRSWTALLRDGIGVVAIVLAAGGFWLVRNLVETGNPIFPNKVALAGVTLLDAPRDVHREQLGFALVDYLGDWTVWREIIWPSFLEFMSWYAVALWALLGVVGLVVGARLRRHERVGGPVLVCLGIAVSVAVFYLFIPYTAFGPEGKPVLAAANARYVVPALVIICPLAAWACRWLGRWGLALQAVALIALFDALAKDPSVSLGALLGAGGVMAAIGITWAASRPERRTWRLRRSHVALGAAGLVAVALLALYGQERRVAGARDDQADATALWVAGNAPDHARVGVAGEGFVVYPMFGPRLRNRVEYVGPIVDGMLRAYERPERFAAALRNGRYDLVLLHDAGLVRPGLPQRHERWLRQMGYELVAAGQQRTAFGQGSRLYRRPVD